MSSASLAGPLEDCCFTSVKHSGIPLGRSISFANVPTYVSDAQSRTQDGLKKIILFFSDVYGPFYLNNQLLQDYFASHGKLKHVFDSEVLSV